MPAETKWVRVGKVPYGRAVFANTDIPAAAFVGALTGKVIHDAEYASPYCIDLGGAYSLEPRAPFRYLNHSCNPNCELVLIEQAYPDGSEAPCDVELHSLRTIPEGDELTIDYAWSADGAIPCLCGSQVCRGWVVAPEELPKLLRQSRRSRPAKPAVAVETQRRGEVQKTTTTAAPLRKPR